MCMQHSWLWGSIGRAGFTGDCTSDNCGQEKRKEESGEGGKVLENNQLLNIYTSCAAVREGWVVSER